MFVTWPAHSPRSVTAFRVLHQQFILETLNGDKIDSPRHATQTNMSLHSDNVCTLCVKQKVVGLHLY